MEWTSDTFTSNDARVLLNLFAPDKATERGSRTFCKYLEEMPPPHTIDAYLNYYEQITPAAIRAQKTDRMEAELWLYALTVRALSFEVEQGFHGPVKQLFCSDPPAADQRPSREVEF